MIREKASQDDRISMTGYITGEFLKSIFSYAKLFVLPSYHEGHPIALLEAMGYNVQVLVSDIPAHKEIGLSSESYFKCGNIDLLAKGMESFLEGKNYKKERELKKKSSKVIYNWDKIAEQTIEVYQQVLGMPK
jgi:glycosyltransferase involved in cell wall biosynthesis